MVLWVKALVRYLSSTFRFMWWNREPATSSCPLMATHILWLVSVYAPSHTERNKPINVTVLEFTNHH